MSGHSKWASIKRQKGLTDAKRGAVFTKLANVITVAAREKGGDPEMNFSLRIAIEKAKSANMPKENIERAIKRGTGEGGGAAIEELIYEAIGPGNSQFIVKCLTDNKNRSASTVRHIFTKHGGAFGAVMWNFERKGVIRIAGSEMGTAGGGQEFDNFELELIDVGADDIEKEDEGITIYSSIENIQKLKTFLEEKKIPTESAEIEFVAKDNITLNDSDKEKVEKIINDLEENEDVNDYYSNTNT
jgi:YebC/PmpR family DNA-binding regulatory protein